MSTHETVTVERGQAIHFADGIPGFPGPLQFVLRDLDPSGTFQMLESVTDPSIAMVVCSPWLIVPGYEAEISEQDRVDLGIEDPDETVVFCAVTVDEEQRAFHVNLLGPFVVNARTRHGRQIVLADSGHPVRHTVRLDELAD